MKIQLSWGRSFFDSYLLWQIPLFNNIEETKLAASSRKECFDFNMHYIETFYELYKFDKTVTSFSKEDKKEIWKNYRI